MANINIAVSNPALLEINKKRIGDALRLVGKTVKADVVALIRANAGHPSKAGQAPSSETGELARSIKVRITNNKKSIGVTVTAACRYGVALEAGANGPGKRHMDPRPYISTILKKRNDWIQKTIQDAIEFK